MEKEVLVPILKKVGSYVIVVLALVSGFFIGRHIQLAENVEELNPYAHAFSPNEISIAVNEGNELLLIERSTGNYIVYSDTIGMTIFDMYSSRIFQDATTTK